MSARLLILTAGFGEGHNAAARALAAAADAAHGPGTARVADVFALAAPRLNAVTRRGYLDLINRTPNLWRAVYAWIDRSALVPHCFRLLRSETRALAAVLADTRPDVICSTFPAYAFLLANLARRGAVLPAHYNIVTDSISINSLWWRAPCTGWFVPNADSAAVLIRAGIDAARIHALGFPVQPFFHERAAEFAPSDLAAGATPRVLYIINSGTRHAVETARRLFARHEWEVTCAVGRDVGLHRRLTELASGMRGRHASGALRGASVLGWTDQIPRLLLTHHVVVSKAGGATTQEAIAARCPMLVNQIVPGQEEGNYELLRRHDAGGLAETPDTVIAELQRAFAAQGRGWQRWRTALAVLARPAAARDIVAHLLPPAPASPQKCHLLDDTVTSPLVSGLTVLPSLRADPEPIPLPLRAAPPPSHCHLIDDTGISVPAGRGAAHRATVA